jgi:hypothetical protein
MGDSSLCILLALVPRADSKKNYCHNWKQMEILMEGIEWILDENV